jgi:nucleotide-binding universal stress UspA family protein
MQIPLTELEAFERRPAESPEPGLAAGPIVVAADGSAASDAAVRVAWSLAGRTNADVRVVSVLEPVPPSVEFASLVPAAPDFWTILRDAHIEMVRAQLARVCAPATEWPLTVLEGVVPDGLARFARAAHARLLVAGRGRHGVARRIFSGESLLGVLELGETPVLAVEPTLTAMPRRVVMAVDFSPGSVYAARVGLSLAAPDATVYLVHVRPELRLADALADERQDCAYSRALPAAFARLRDRLAPNGACTVEMAVVSGRPGPALAEFAESVRADLVVSGTHGYGFIDRFLLGSVCTSLLRHAPCSVLGVPNSAALRRGGH